MTRTSESILSVENLTCTYGDAEIIANASFDLSAGSITMLMGANGAGKSTLLRCLAGWSHPKAGAVSVCGKEWKPANRDLRARIAFVPDTPSFYDDLTAEEHLRFMLGANRKLDDYPYAEGLLKDFGLFPHRRQFPSSYSRGMREKLALTIAFSCEPALLLLDEPYGPLDRRSADRLSEEIDRMVGRGAAVLVSCHQAMPGLSVDSYMIIEDGAVRLESEYPEDAWWMQAVAPHDDDEPASDDAHAGGQTAGHA